MIKKHWKILLVVLVIIVIGSGVYRYYLKADNKEEGQKIDPGLVMEVTRGNLDRTVNASGYLAPVRERELVFTGGDRLVELAVEEGDKVDKGDLLARQDQQQEKLNLLQAENEYQRVKIDGTSSQIKEAELNLQIAKQKLEDTELKAPFGGIVTEVNSKEGDFIAGGKVLIKLADLDEFKVELDVEENDTAELEAGQKAEASVGALSKQKMQGELIEMGQYAEVNSGIVTLPVTVLLERGQYFIRPGFSVEVDIIVGEAEDEIVIPITAVMSREGRDVVFRVEDGETRAVPVETGLTDGTRIVVLEGLNVGDKILTNAAARNSGGAGNTFGQGGFMPPGNNRMSGGRQ